jgi:hypothetical protein
MNVRNRDRINELIRTAKPICKIDNALLVFKTNSTGKRQEYFDEVHANLLKNSEIVESKKAFVSEIAGMLYMHLENEL